MPPTLPIASIVFPKLHLPLFGDGRFAATKFDRSADIHKRLRDARVLDTYRAARATKIRDAERDVLRLKAQYEPEPAPPLSNATVPVAVHHGPQVQLGLF